MRRIIERKVTVVTTTTWTISWQDDPLYPSSEPSGQTQGEAEPIHPAESNTDNSPVAQIPSPVIELKEADTEIEEKPVGPTVPSKGPHSYPSKIERK